MIPTLASDRAGRDYAEHGSPGTDRVDPYRIGSNKLDVLGHLGGVNSFLRVWVREAQRRYAVFVDGGATIADAGQRMQEADMNALLVQGGKRVGVITAMNLPNAQILRRLPLERPYGKDAIVMLSRWIRIITATKL